MHNRVARLIGFALSALLVNALPSSAQVTLGAKYHTREPATCASMKEPVNGPPSAAQAAKYLACSLEREDSYHLYLLGDIVVEVGKGTPYTQLSGSSRPGNGDVDGLVYSIRGSYKLYQCTPPSALTEEGKQCNRYDNLRAEGTCYHTNFGDWYCNMRDRSVARAVSDQPPPR